MSKFVHPFETLKTEYAALLAGMQITRKADVDQVAHRLMDNRARYAPVSQKTGIPIIWIAASFEREASSDFRRSPAQGDFWNKVSVHVPKGRGPFPNWEAAALDAYHLNGLDKVGSGNWTWELACFYGELFNGFGYRDYHHMRSPYLWGGTNQQERGKYTEDGKFDPTKFDIQLGIVPLMKAMVALDPSLDIGNSVTPAPSQAGIVLQHSPEGVGGTINGHDTKWMQEALNTAGYGPHLEVDGHYGTQTWLAARNYQIKQGLTPDGFCGTKTVGDLEKFLASVKA